MNESPSPPVVCVCVCARACVVCVCARVCVVCVCVCVCVWDSYILQSNQPKCCLLDMLLKFTWFCDHYFKKHSIIMEAHGKCRVVYVCVVCNCSRI